MGRKSGKEQSLGACLQLQLVTFCKLEPNGGALSGWWRPVEENFGVSAESTGSEARTRTDRLNRTRRLRFIKIVADFFLPTSVKTTSSACAWPADGVLVFLPSLEGLSLLGIHFSSLPCRIILLRIWP